MPEDDIHKDQCEIECNDLRGVSYYDSSIFLEKRILLLNHFISHKLEKRQNHDISKLYCKVK